MRKLLKYSGVGIVIIFLLVVKIVPGIYKTHSAVRDSEDNKIGTCNIYEKSNKEQLIYDTCVEIYRNILTKNSDLCMEDKKLLVETIENAVVKLLNSVTDDTDLKFKELEFTNTIADNEYYIKVDALYLPNKCKDIVSEKYIKLSLNNNEEQADLK